MAQQRVATDTPLEDRLDAMASEIGSLRKSLRRLHQGVSAARDELAARRNKIGYRQQGPQGEGENNE